MPDKPWKGRFGYTVLPPLGRFLLPLYWLTVRRSEILGSEHLDRVLTTAEPVILCYWHQMHLMGSRLLRGLDRRGLRLGVLVSPSGDGELAARLGRKWVSETIRASSSRTGAQGLRQLHEAIRDRSLSLLVTSDGPRGPLHEFKPGAILLAQTTGAPIVPLAYAASRAWQLGSWDQFIVPKPFSRVVWAIGEPRYVARDSTLRDLGPIQRELEETMAGLVTAARRRLTRRSTLRSRPSRRE